ncbi:unnamed protein product [Brachionus calyciflorus]|uniref:TRIM56 n=1 Tax=Brachionus calyciflorus TaxID=104777 RepID=A0A814AVR1_9BILA|nr:unnamed protein product [Brachionus calyciflorus]
MANTQTQAMQLAEQINDEFLTCKICFEHYKDPKCLSCLHTFCEECIEQHVSAQRSYKYTDYREFSCPICRKKTVIPSGGVRKLNDNFLISSLNELLLSKRPSKIRECEICKIVHQRDRDATSKCVECQKLMCDSCASQHQTMKITQNHSIYELENEKDIMCKEHPNEQVRFYCEQCEICVCVPCTFTDHLDHDLVDFKSGIAHHKDTIEQNLRKCRQKISDIKNRLDQLRQCETRILYTQDEIHSCALSFIEAIRQKEKSLIEELKSSYGEETNEYLGKKDELEAFLDQLKSTCNLTDMVVKGKDIEMLLLKKQLCDKFEEFEEINLDAVPDNLTKKVNFIPGNINLGSLVESENNNPVGIARGISAKYNSFDEDYENDHHTKYPVDKHTQITYRDMRDLMGDFIKESEAQTDIKMIHELATGNRSVFEKKPVLPPNNYSLKMDAKETQTDAVPSHPPLSSQSSIDEDMNPNAPVDRNKLGKRVRRHVKPGCSIAVLPSSEIIIIDPDANSLSILDRRGKFRYGMSNSNKPCTEQGNQPSAQQFGQAVFGNLPKLDRGIRLMTPQGILVIKLENNTSSSAGEPSEQNKAEN